MRILHLILIFVLVGALRSAHATTVTFGAAPSARTVTASDTTSTITSGLAWVGNFSSEAFTFNPLLSISANVTAITTAGGWNQFSLDVVTDTPDTAVINTMTITGTGKVGGSVTDNNSGATKADFFNGKSLYLWLFNASTPSAATQMGIFRSTNGAPAWTFATNAGGVGDSITYGTTTTLAPTVSVIGGAGSANSTQLILVPEPTTLALAGIAAFGMLSARRRKQRK